METKKKALGKGLEELFSNSSFTIDTLEDTIVKEERNNATEIDLSQIRSNPYQPRKVFDEEALNELADSIKVYGVVEPVILKKSVKGYEIVAGERRCKASKIAGLTTVPAIIKDFTDEEMMEIALLENIQREDLNPVDTAISISNILQVKDMTQEEFSKKFGKSRSYITNLLGLLNLPKSVQELVKNGKLSMSHARCLSKIDDEEKVINLANKIIKENLNVRDIEKMLSKKDDKKVIKEKNEKFRMYEDAFSDTIGNKVRISNKKIEISYNSMQDLNRIMEILNINFND
ncbi:MAG: ParB/RepB/Spo0J family partition protein [Bacilli bacterium]|nr:ParB/RepB/Spo0J family partition protein [Bacilli bacterium]